MDNTWNEMAHLFEVNYGGLVDWNDRCFYCPECGEPIYEEDWNPCDFYDGDGNYICPICESVIEQDIYKIKEKYYNTFIMLSKMYESAKKKYWAISDICWKRDNNIN